MRAQHKSERNDALKNSMKRRKSFKSGRTSIPIWRTWTAISMKTSSNMNFYSRELSKASTLWRMKSSHAIFLLQCKTITDPIKVNSDGFAYFRTLEEAQKAVQVMKVKIVGHKPLYVRFGQQKDQRRAQLEAQHAQRKQIKPHQVNNFLSFSPPLPFGIASAHQ